MATFNCNSRYYTDHDGRYVLEMSSQKTVSRNKVFRSDEFTDMRKSLLHVAEKRQNWNPYAPIRGMPFEAFFKYKEKHSLEESVMNPDLPRIFHERFGVRTGEYAQGYQEAVSIPANLVQLKVADMVLEGAEPYSQWKETIRVVDMPSPKFNVPIDTYRDWIGSENFEIYRAGAGGPVDMGGQSRAVELDTEDDNGYYRAKIGIRRNDIRDNKFLAVEQNLKNSGAAWYYALGKKILDFYLATVTNTDTLANLRFQVTTVHQELEGLTNVIRSKFPGTLRNRADTMFMNPEDAFLTVARSTGASGVYPFLDNRMLAPTDEDVINNSGMAKALGLKRAFETPQMTKGKVLIIKRDIAAVFGLYQDLEIEDFDQNIAGITESALSMRIDIKDAHQSGKYVITGYT